MDNGSGTDRIRINDLRVRSIVGINDWEQEKKQDVSISLTLHTDLRKAGASDQIEDTVDYKTLKKKIMGMVEATKFLLIERMAEEVAKLCLEDPKVERVDVTVDKLGALRFASSVAVEISRYRRDK